MESAWYLVNAQQTLHAIINSLSQVTRSEIRQPAQRRTKLGSETRVESQPTHLTMFTSFLTSVIANWGQTVQW